MNDSSCWCNQIGLLFGSVPIGALFIKIAGVVRRAKPSKLSNGDALLYN